VEAIKAELKKIQAQSASTPKPAVRNASDFNDKSLPIPTMISKWNSKSNS
jgi:hypothetical protein